MATDLYFNEQSGNSIETISYSYLNGSSGGVDTAYLSSTRGASVNSEVVSTVNGPTNGIEFSWYGSPKPTYWLSLPIESDVTISGTITFNLRMLESNMSANAGAGCKVMRVDHRGVIISTIVNSARNVEMGTTEAAQNWTATPTSTNMNKGDRIAVAVYADDAVNGVTNMVTAYTVSFYFDGTTAAASGDSWIRFNETFTLATTGGTGTQFFLRDTAGPAVGANIEKMMETTRGASATSITVNQANGWHAPIQWTNTAGGTAVEWFSPQLNAFTLGGYVNVNPRLSGNASPSDNSGACWGQLAVVNNDGTGEVIYGESGMLGNFFSTESVDGFNFHGDDTAVTAGQRLRLRLYVDDQGSAPDVAGFTATLYYDGPTASASGDSWIRLSQNVTEYGGAAPGRALPQRRADRFLTRR